MSEELVCQAHSTPRAALFWTTLAFFGGFAGVSAFGPIVSTMKAGMGLDPLLMGLLAACPALSGSLLRIPFGAMVDRMGGKWPILVLLTLAAIGVAGMTFVFTLSPTPKASHYPWFVVFGILCGCGIALFSVGIPTVSYWYPQRTQGSALAVYAGLGNLAPGLFALLLPFLVTALGYTVSYVMWMVMLVLLIAMIALFMKDAPYFQYKQMGIDIDPDALLLACGEELVPSGTALASIRKAGADWRTWVLTFFYFISFGGFIALTVWFPTYWSERFGASLTLAGALTAAYSLSSSLLRVAGGYVSDKVGGERLTSAAFIITGVGAVIVALAGGAMVAAVVGAMLLALGMGFANAAVFKLVPRYSPTAVGGAAGIVGGLGAFGGFVIPPIMGLFVHGMGRDGYAMGFVVFLGFSLAALPLLVLLRRRQPIDA